MNSRTRVLLALGAIGGLAALLLYPDNPSGEAPPSVPTLRAQALKLCGLYLPHTAVVGGIGMPGCVRGDAHYLEICKDYGGVGTTCGYLIAWLLFRLGCRDPRLVNRSEMAAGLAYHVAGNMTAVVSGGQAVGAWRWAKDATPEPGDVLYFHAEAFIQGASNDPHEHVAVLVSYPPGGTGDLVTYDLGHSIQPEGSLTVRKMVNGVVQFIGSARRIVGFDSLALVPISAEADLTDHTLAVA